MNRYTILLFLALFMVSNLSAQEKEEEHSTSTINVKFYHIDTKISLDKTVISGNVYIEYLATIDDLKTVELDLNQGLKISKIDGAASFEQKENKIIIQLAEALAKDSKGTLKIFYEGEAPSETGENGVKRGLIRSTHGKKNNTVIATVCFPEGASLWFPCKESSYDKADSVYIDITIESRKVEEIFYNPNTKKEVVAEIPMIAVSNGNLEGIETKDGKKKFKWRHRHRIAPHHIMIAISDYMKIEKKFNARGSKYPIDFYIFPEKFKESRAMFNRAPEIMDCLTNTFGTYPYKNERFAITMVGIPLGLDGMPTQTNVMLEDMKSTHMYKLVHQSASMWFGNHISPATWQDAWITEALAAYAEAMWQEYKRGLNVYQIILDQKEYFEGGKLYLDKKENYSKERFNKKGMYVLHMLRGVMGDSYFFASLQAITGQKRIRGKKAKTYLSTQNFQKICEYFASENVDIDYQYFFDQWVYGEYFPKYSVKYSLNKKQVTLDIYQVKRDFDPELFAMPVKLEIISTEGRVQTKIIEVTKERETFVFDVSEDVREVEFDPFNWVFKDLEYTCQILNTKYLLHNFNLVPTNYRRKVEISFNSPKKQDLVIELIQIADGVLLTEDKVVSTQKIDKHIGDFKQSFKIPLSYTQRGAFKLVVKGKGGIYSKQVRLKRIKKIF